MASQEQAEKTEQTEQPEAQAEDPMRTVLTQLVLALDTMTDLTRKMWQHAEDNGQAAVLDQLARAMLLSQSHQAAMLQDLRRKMDRLLETPALPQQDTSAASTPRAWTIRSPGRLPLLPELKEEQPKPKLRRQNAQLFPGQPDMQEEQPKKKLRRQNAQLDLGQPAVSRERSRSLSSQKTVSYDDTIE